MQGPEPSEAEFADAFERLLDEALHSRQVRDVLDCLDGTLDRGELRTRALLARAVIVSSAGAEYRAYLEARAAQAAWHGERADGIAQGVGARGDGGLLPVLVPGLAAVCAVVFLVSGYGLQTAGGRPYVGGGLITAGLIAAAVAVGGVIGDLVCRAVPAVRQLPAEEGSVSRCAVQDVSGARERWERALVERGMVPFLLDCVREVRAEEQDGQPAC